MKAGDSLHVTFNHGVEGSSPSALTNEIKYLIHTLIDAINAYVGNVSAKRLPFGCVAKFGGASNDPRVEVFRLRLDGDQNEQRYRGVQSLLRRRQRGADAYARLPRDRKSAGRSDRTAEVRARTTIRRGTVTRALVAVTSP